MLINVDRVKELLKNILFIYYMYFLAVGVDDADSKYKHYYFIAEKSS